MDTRSSPSNLPYGVASQPHEGQSPLHATAPQTLAVRTANASAIDDKSAKAMAEILWTEAPEGAAFEGHFRLRSLWWILFGAVIVLLTTTALGEFVNVWRDQGFSPTKFFDLIYRLFFLSLFGLVAVNRGWGQFTVNSTQDALVIERRWCFGLLKQRVSIAHSSCFGVGVRFMRGRWHAVLINWDGEVTNTPIWSANFEHVSFLVARLNQHLTERRTRTHYR